MPLEIRELHIKVTVNQPRQNTSEAPGTAASPGATKTDDDKEALVSQCVEQVIEIINHKKER
ncbi:MAG: DUF5908 family protein [Ferruginibacter sp.]